MVEYGLHCWVTMALLIVSASAAANGTGLSRKAQARNAGVAKIWQANPMATYVGERALNWPTVDAATGPLHTKRIFYPLPGATILVSVAPTASFVCPAGFAGHRRGGELRCEVVVVRRRALLLLVGR